MKQRLATLDGEALSKNKVSKEYQDLKPKMYKWKAFFQKQTLNNELNKLHVYDPTVLKRDLKQNLQILN